MTQAKTILTGQMVWKSDILLAAKVQSILFGGFTGHISLAEEMFAALMNQGSTPSATWDCPSTVILQQGVLLFDVGKPLICLGTSFVDTAMSQSWVSTVNVLYQLR